MILQKINILKNKIIKFIFIKFIILFFLFISFFLLIFFSINNKYENLNSHIILNAPLGYKKDGFDKVTIIGTCFGEGIKKEKCNNKNDQFLKKISYSYAGTSNDPEKFLEHVNYYIKTYKIKNFIIPGFSTSEFFRKYINFFAKKYPEVRFIGIDTDLEDVDNWYSNFWQVNFLHYYSGYHAGIYAAAWALENKEKFKDSDLNKEGKQIHFGSIGGLSVLPIFKYALGFKLGINMFNKMYQSNKSDKDEKIEFIHKYYEDIGSFDVSDITVKNKMEKKTKNMFIKGASVIFIISSPLQEIAVDAIKEINKKISEGKHYVVGVDIDLYEIIGTKSKKNIITSAIIDFSRVIEKIYKTDFKNNEKGKNLLIGGHEYGSIPERDKKNKIWKKYFGFNGKFKTIVDFDDSLKSFFEILNDKKISTNNNENTQKINLWINEFIDFVIKKKDSNSEYKKVLIKN